MDRKTVLCGIVAGAMLCIAAASAYAEDVVIKVWSRADRSGPLRAGNLVAAGDTLNKMLAAAGSDKRVKIELNETNAKGYDDDAFDLLESLRRRQGSRHLRAGARMDGGLRRGGLRAQPRGSHRQEPGALRRHHRAPLAVGELQGRALRRAAGLRGSHVFPEQRQAPQDGQDRQGDCRACPPKWTRANSPRTTCAISPARRCRRAS